MESCSFDSSILLFPLPCLSPGPRRTRKKNERTEQNRNPSPLYRLTAEPRPRTPYSISQKPEMISQEAHNPAISPCSPYCTDQHLFSRQTKTKMFGIPSCDFVIPCPHENIPISPISCTMRSTDTHANAPRYVLLICTLAVLRTYGVSPPQPHTLSHTYSRDLFLEPSPTEPIVFPPPLRLFKHAPARSTLVAPRQSQHRRETINVSAMQAYIQRINFAHRNPSKALRQSTGERAEKPREKSPTNRHRYQSTPTALR